MGPSVCNTNAARSVKPGQAIPRPHYARPASQQHEEGTRQRVVLKIHQHAVAFDVITEKRGALARASAVHMPNNGLGGIDEGPAALASTPGQVQVLVIHKQAL